MTPAWALGFSRRKRGALRAFFDERPLRFARHASQVPDGADLLVWGSLPFADVGRLRSLWRVEDGFLRSVGLGAAFARPSSWVFDAEGIHYDATRASSLERLLATCDVDAALLARAAALRRRIVAAGITKYNLTGSEWQRPAGARHVCLVAGQVESDASLALGSPMIRSNMELLRQIRLARPDAFIVYKPHPDVVAGVRRAGTAEREAHRYCNAMLTDAGMSQLLGQVDECHVLTSLAGFEALLRGVPVTTWGQPFYAGWGLTVDRLPPPRRTRRLQLDELVAGTLLRYPRYVGADGRRVEAEAVLDEFLAARKRSGIAAALAGALGLAAGRLLQRTRDRRTDVARFVDTMNQGATSADTDDGGHVPKHGVSPQPAES